MRNKNKSQCNSKGVKGDHNSYECKYLRKVGFSSWVEVPNELNNHIVSWSPKAFKGKPRGGYLKSFQEILWKLPEAYPGAPKIFLKKYRKSFVNKLLGDPMKAAGRISWKTSRRLLEEAPRKPHEGYLKNLLENLVETIWRIFFKSWGGSLKKLLENLEKAT